MSILKSEIKSLIIYDLGNQVDDMLDAAKKEVSGYEGAKQALSLATKKLEDHQKYVDRDKEEGKLTEEEHGIATKYVDHCGGILRNMVTTAEAQLLQAHGKVSALTSVVAHVKTMYDNEANKLAALKSAELASKNNPTATRAVGQHPGNVLADRKLDTQKQTTKTNTTKRSKKNAKDAG